MNELTDSLVKSDLIRLCDDLKIINENASQIATLSQRAKDSAGLGFSALTDVQSTLTSFVNSTREINALLEQINMLSQQVHILGVNAAIEAANAGEQGSGFTIIAEEMRRIAGQVKETAINVQSIMEMSGTLADETVSAIETASENLEVLEVSADISLGMNKDNAEKAASHKLFLEQTIKMKEADE